jgi:hypothetical protein
MHGRNQLRGFPGLAAAFGTALLAAAPLGCDSAPAPGPGEGFALVRMDTGDIVLSDRDLAGYDAGRHALVLNDEGIRRWNSTIHFDRSFDPPIPKLGGLYQKEFSFRIEGEEIYRGRFWSMASSLGITGVVVLDVLFPLDREHDRLFFVPAFPPGSPAGPGVVNPLDDPRIAAYFGKAGLLE